MSDECSCPMHGYCERRKVYVNSHNHRLCKNGKVLQLDDMYSRVINPPSKERVVKSTIGVKIREIVEKEIGYTIQCGTCLNFFRTIKDNTDAETIVSGLLLHSPTPDWWRVKYKNRAERKARYLELISGLVQVPEPAPAVAYKDEDWSVVVTTAPRRDPTIEVCLSSLRKAGWEPVVFAEPDSYKPEGYRYLNNDTKQGAWFNWLRSVKWALERTQAKFIMSVQDDSLFHPDSRELAEQLIWPSDKVGFLSLYTAAHYSTNRSGELKPRGVNRVETTSLWGACALIFPREALQQIVDHPIVPTWTGVPPNNLTDKQKLELVEKKKENPHLIQNVDTALGRIINGLHLEMWFVDPSPVQHVAQYSSIGHANSNSGKRNCGRCADHSKPLFKQVFPQ